MFSAETLIGPASGLAISLFFSFQFLKEYKTATERLTKVFETELKSCNERYELIFNELMKLKGEKNEP